MTAIETISPASAPIEPLILVEEISHRVVNEYSQAIAIIRLAAAEVVSREAREALGSAATRLIHFAEAHRALQAPRGSGIDVGSRPQGRSVWNGKPCAIASVTPGAMGGFGANHHLRQALVFLNMPRLNQPEAYIGHAAGLVADDFSIPNESTRAFLESFMRAFGELTDRVSFSVAA
jgi:NAD(P)H-dependent FMN reductase